MNPEKYLEQLISKADDSPESVRMDYVRSIQKLQTVLGINESRTNQSVKFVNELDLDKPDQVEELKQEIREFHDEVVQ